VSRRLLVPLGAVLAMVAVATLALVAASSSARRGASTTTLEGPLMPPGVTAPAITLRDQDGAWTSLAQYRGRVVVLTFLHSRCTGACPIIAQQIRAALDDLGPRARDVTALAVSVDPAQDTPASARHFLYVQQVRGKLRFLVGSRAALAPVWKAYGIQPVGSRDGHTLFAYLIDRSGHLRVGYPGSSITPEALAHDAGVLLAG
jgi:protein SCO1